MLYKFSERFHTPETHTYNEQIVRYTSFRFPVRFCAQETNITDKLSVIQVSGKFLYTGNSITAKLSFKQVSGKVLHTGNSITVKLLVIQVSG